MTWPHALKRFNIMYNQKPLAKMNIGTIMKARSFVIALAAIFLGTYSSPAQAADSSANINLLTGSRSLLDSGWKSTGAHQASTLGIDFDYTNDRWPVSFYMGLSGYRDSGEKVNLDTNLDVKEIALGARMYVGRGGFVNPYAGAGLAFMDVAVDQETSYSSSSDKGSSTGYFLNVGVALNFLGIVNVGLDGRWIGGTSPSGGITKLDYYQTAFVLGISL